MTIDERIAKVQQDYTTIQAERNGLVTKANEMQIQLDKLSAQFELLIELKNEAPKVSKANKKATTVEAVAEE